MSKAAAMGWKKNAKPGSSEPAPEQVGGIA
jgi:hypothetical protein